METETKTNIETEIIQNNKGFNEIEKFVYEMNGDIIFNYIIDDCIIDAILICHKCFNKYETQFEYPMNISDQIDFGQCFCRKDQNFDKNIIKFGKIIEEYPNYIIYENGNIFNYINKNIMKPSKQSYYYVVSLTKKINNKNITDNNIKVHQLVAKKFIPNSNNKPYVDHIDGFSNNNHINNLRWTTCSENTQNCKKKKNGSSIFKGVRLSTNKLRWELHFYGQYLNSFQDEKEAALEYDKLAREEFGEFARCNFHENGEINPDIKMDYIEYLKNPNAKDENGCFISHRQIIIKEITIDNNMEYKIIENFSRYRIYPDGSIYSCIKMQFLLGYINKNGYIHVKIISDKCIKKSFQVHRLIAKCFIPNPENKPVVDHINGLPYINNVNNLRWATHLENSTNTNKSNIRKSSSKYKGVSKICNGNWMAKINHIYIGLYKTEKEASNAYDEYALKLWGEYSKLNSNISPEKEISNISVKQFINHSYKIHFILALYKNEYCNIADKIIYENDIYFDDNNEYKCVYKENNDYKIRFSIFNTKYTLSKVSNKKKAVIMLDLFYIDVLEIYDRINLKDLINIYEKYLCTRDVPDINQVIHIIRNADKIISQNYDKTNDEMMAIFEPIIYTFKNKQEILRQKYAITDISSYQIKNKNKNKNEYFKIEKIDNDQYGEYVILTLFPKYKIYKNGKIYGIKNLPLYERLRNGTTSIDMVNIYGKKCTFKVDILIANIFIPNPDNKQKVGHKDDFINNNVENLFWCTEVEFSKLKKN